MDLDAPVRRLGAPGRADALQRRPGTGDDTVGGEDYRSDSGARGVLAEPRRFMRPSTRASRAHQQAVVSGPMAFSGFRVH